MRIELDLVLANRDDLADGNQIRVGTIYFLKSMITQKIEGPYRLHAFMDKEDQLTIKEYLDHNMIYIPKVNIKQNIKTITP